MRFSFLPLSRAIRAVLVGGAMASLSAVAGSLSDTDFEQPPQYAKPLVWWHWMSGNVTESGIAKDMAWMNRVGIGGVQNFDAHLMTPKIVETPVNYMSDDWQKKFQFALAKARQYDFEFGIAASPGWSETGGPWVQPKDGMKKITWSETYVTDGSKKAIKLIQPPQSTGVFQDYAQGTEMFQDESHSTEHGPHYYEDIAVYAIPVTAEPVDITNVTTSYGEPLSLALMQDGSYTTGATTVSGPDEALAITFDLGEVRTLQSASFAMPIPGMFLPAAFAPVVQASADGKQFTDVAEFVVETSVQKTVSFAPVQARYMRLVMRANPNGTFELPSSTAPGSAPPPGFKLPTGEPQVSPVNLLEVAFYEQSRVHRFEDKAGFGIVEDYYPLSYQQSAEGIPASEIINVTDALQDDGTLTWQPLKGTWKILRVGYSLTGKENHPATPESTGLEVDKYDPVAVRAYLEHYLGKYAKASGEYPLGEGVQALLNDSIEIGPSNWTPAMFAEFKVRRGYDLHPWLPVLTGVVVNNAMDSDKFLFDFRLTLAEMIADNHYGVISDILDEHNMLHYSEALENGRPALGDGMRMRRTADIPMAAMWSFDTKKKIGPAPQYWSDIREAASVAHIYGQNKVAAESLTAAASPWAFSPRDLQPMIDMEFALGVNRPIIHTSVHQPLDNAPGLSLFVFGQYFNRLDTWAEFAKPWVTYISRNTYMLQQGRFFADVAYFYGEETPLTALYNDKPAQDVPRENGFDYVNADIIRDLLSVENGQLVTPSGQRYQVLYLGGTSQYMSLSVLKKLAKLVQKGATVVGRKPQASPSLQDDSDEFSALADALWSGKTGKGRVIEASDITLGLKKAQVSADFSYDAEHDDTEMFFVHRQTESEDIYFYTHRQNRTEAVTLHFAVTGKTPYHYNAVTGAITAVDYKQVGGFTEIKHVLAPFESGYIVFSDDARATERQPSNPSNLVSLDNEWTVSFQTGRGAPVEPITMRAGDWAESSDGRIKYFSGTATYQQTVEITTLPKGKALILDLGDVRELVEVSVNGKVVETLWKPPYQADVTDYLSTGSNSITLKVTNLWVNRLIGDVQPGAKDTYTFTTLPTYIPEAPLRKSGLLGPVSILSQ